MDEELEELFRKINNNEYFELSFKNMRKMTEEQEKWALGKLATLPDKVIREHQRKKLSKLMIQLEDRAYANHGEVSLTYIEIQDVWKQLRLLEMLLEEKQ